ncbi:hypothetical protein CHELA40_10958 [Chelatococcus asaccharovorans]|nr:hypothetical protein CHELA40_10958 [Chelatococcus asaccharovorans]
MRKGQTKNEAARGARQVLSLSCQSILTDGRLPLGEGVPRMEIRETARTVNGSFSRKPHADAAISLQHRLGDQRSPRHHLRREAPGYPGASPATQGTASRPELLEATG